LVDMSLQNVVARELYERLIKSFMDVIVLKKLKNGNLIGAYDVIALIYRRFRIFMSSGSVYSLMYSMERNGLIEGTMDKSKRVYKLTEKGRETLENISESGDKIVLLLKSILEE